jgi:hypothetical protein
MDTRRMISLLCIGLVASGASSALPSEHTVSLTQAPLVMRVDKDEFRIAFAIDGQACGQNGCTGSIRYRVEWQTAQGAKRSEIKQVGYTVSPLVGRTIAVDRQYFDTAEGAHTTEVLKVSVDRITCHDGIDAAN